jgi:hypothetical protein
MENSAPIDQNQYLKFLDDVKGHIQNSRIRIASSVNKELIQLYWWIDIIGSYIGLTRRDAMLAS